MAAPTAIAATKQPKICRIMFAAQPQLFAPTLQVIHRVIATFLIKQSGLRPRQANTGAVTLIQRFGSAANLNIHLHCLVLDGVYLNCDGAAIFHEAAAPSTDELEAVLLKIITRTMHTGGLARTANCLTYIFFICK